MCSLSIALIARDKLSTAPLSLASICSDFLPQNTSILVCDPGYPPEILQLLHEVSGRNSHRVEFLQVPTFANTNQAWNSFVSSQINSEFLMCLENDVEVRPGTVSACLDALRQSEFDVVVPVVYESDGITVHFNPPASRLVRIEDGGIRTELDRGRVTSTFTAGSRQIAHLERHCFMINRAAARKLGELDEQMYCRTDLDLSLACFAAPLKIGILTNASVVFHRAPDLAIDRAFFDYRWNLERVRFAHDRVIAKWNLVGYKRTIDHAHEIRKFLESES